MQEVSRNFLKDRVERHEVEFVLLAGDHSILPPRSLCGSAVCGHVDAFVRRKGYWTLHLDEDDLNTSNTHYPVRSPAHPHPAHRGTIVPYDPFAAPGGSTLRWFYRDSLTFQTLSPTRTTTEQSPTPLLRVEGPATLLADDAP